MPRVSLPRILVFYLVAAAFLVTAGVVAHVRASVVAADDFATQVLVLINQQRIAQGLAPFAWQANLAAAAQAHSQDLAAHHFCSHNGSDGSNPGTRIARAGYRARAWGETVGCGQQTPGDVVNAWMNSPGHRAILMGQYQHAGVGHAGNYWTVNTGSGQSTVAPASTPAVRRPSTSTRTQTPTRYDWRRIGSRWYKIYTRALR